MSRNPLDVWTVKSIVKAAAMTNADDKNADAEIDLGADVKNAIWIISAAVDSSDFNELSIHTSDVTGFSNSSSNICTITQDVSNSAATVVINSNIISDITTDGVYSFFVENLERYVNIDYDAEKTSQRAAMVLIGVDVQQNPKASRESSY